MLRRTLHETQDASARASKNAGTIRGLLKNHWRAFVTVVGYTAGGSLVFYTYTTYMQKYLVNTVGLPIKTASHVMTGALLVFVVLQPIMGALSALIAVPIAVSARSLTVANHALQGAVGVITVVIGLVTSVENLLA